MMLRHQHYRINTTSLKHRKLSPYQKPVRSVVIYEIQSHHVTSHQVYFLMTSDTLPSSGCDP